MMSGCSNEKMKKLEEDKNENNKQVEIVMNNYESNKNSAVEVEDDILNYLKYTSSEQYNIQNPNIQNDSSFESNMIAYKAHLQENIKAAVDAELLNKQENSGLTEQEIKEKTTKEILDSIKIFYFMNTKNEQLEQTVMYKSYDGSHSIFTAIWQSNKCISSNNVNTGGLKK